MRGSWRVSGLLMAGLLSCSTTTSEPLPDAPKIVIFPDSQSFGSDVGFGTYVGTTPQQSFSIKNMGKQTLVISSVSKSGDSAFSFVGPSVADATADGGVVDSKQETFIRVTFAPTAAKTYSGKLTIKSNAATAELIAIDGGTITPPDPAAIDIPLSGLGVLAPDGGPDGG
jgi:hypothetical protein